MTISNQTNRTSAVGSGSTGQEVPFSFPITDSSNLTVFKRVTATGVQTTLAETTNYIVSVSGDTGGTLTTVTAIETTEEIHLVRTTPFTQSLDLVQGGSYSAEDIEDGFDKATKLAIRNSDALDRTLKFPDTDPASSFADMPNSVDRASKNLTFDVDGKPTASVVVNTGEVTFSDIGVEIAEAANASTVRGIVELDTDDDVEFAAITGTTGTFTDIVVKGPWVDVRAFGATGDGVTDDTTAIEAAVTALVTAGGGTLYFPPGDYLITPSATGVIAITDLVDFRIVGDGAKIFCAAYSAADAGSKLFVFLKNCSNFTVSGIHFLHQIDFATDGTTADTDETLRIDYDDSASKTNGDTKNFAICNNTFEYIGPLISGSSRKLYIVHLNSDQSTFPLRQVRDFSIYGNHFKRCIGRTLQIFRCANGSVCGNTWEELGYLVHPLGNYETWAEALGVRISSCSNISTTGNTLTGYSGDLVNEGGKGEVVFMVSNTVSGDASAGHGENITFTGNTIKANSCDGIGIAINHTYSTVVTGNTILGDEANTSANFQAVIYATGPTVDTVFSGNIIKHIPIVFDTDHTKAYVNNIVEGNLITKGSNHVALYANGAKTNLLFGRNYFTGTGWIDGRSIVCNENQVVCNGNQVVYN